MSTELKLLRCIATSESTNSEPPHLPTLMASLGVSPSELREAKSHRPGRAGNAKPKAFRGSRAVSQPRIPTPLLGANVLRANRNTESPVFDQDWVPPQMVEIRQQAPLTLPPYLVRESELEELKPR